MSGKVKVKESVYIKIDVHVSLVARHSFKEHNRIYRQTLSEKLKTYRQQQKILFEQLLEYRQTEDAVAEIIARVIYKYIETEAVVQLTNKLKQTLRGYLPTTKNLLIIEICNDFVDSCNFSDIVKYIFDPMNSAQLWFVSKAKSYMFSGTPTKFSECSVQIIENMYSNIFKSLECLQTSDDEMASTNRMIDILLSKLEENTIFISESDLLAIRRFNQEAKINLKAVGTAIANKSKQLKSKLSFSSYTKDSVWWKGKSPYQDIFERVWGCTKYCPYCREPCQRSNDSHPEDHICVQHRPECCRGVREKNTTQAVPTTCNYLVQTDLLHNCHAFACKCKDGQSECSEQWHRYREYRTFLKDWYISPSSDMYDSSKFWLWFVGKFKYDLGKTFNYKLDDIPTSWSTISSKDAKESLRSVYG